MRFHFPSSSLVLALCALALPASSQTLQSEMALDLRAVGEKYVALAEAVPESAYDWRPAEGVRSMGEVFMHIASANLGLPAQFMDVAPPEGYPQEWFGTAEQVGDKAEIVRHLRTAFHHLAQAMEEMGDEELQRPVNVFGRDTNRMGAALLLVTHSHEHLGQAIAYARSNGVTPPWSR